MHVAGRWLVHIPPSVSEHIAPQRYVVPSRPVVLVCPRNDLMDNWLRLDHAVMHAGRPDADSAMFVLPEHRDLGRSTVDEDLVIPEVEAGGEEHSLPAPSLPDRVFYLIEVLCKTRSTADKILPTSRI
eukprot:240639-Hanusia_phi.AAC.1